MCNLFGITQTRKWPTTTLLRIPLRRQLGPPFTRKLSLKKSTHTTIDAGRCLKPTDSAYVSWL